MKIEYLLFNIIVFFSPILSKIFLPQITRLPKIKPLAFSILMVAVFYVTIDNIVTDYFWSFNEKYILGFKIFKLPIEEILFFFTVPFSTLFLWENWKRLFDRKSKLQINPNIILITLTILAIFFIFSKMHYSTMVIFLIILSFAALLKFTPSLVFRYDFWGFTAVVSLLTLIFNFYLTARPVVLYANQFKTNIMILTIPIEDFLFGLSMIILNLVIYEASARSKKFIQIFKAS